MWDERGSLRTSDDDLIGEAHADPVAWDRRILLLLLPPSMPDTNPPFLFSFPLRAQRNVLE
jgi:hypothetical protein